MFEQYNVIQKISRVVIYVSLVYVVLVLIPDEKISNEDICKIICAMTFVFLIYDFYFPAVRIELDREKSQAISR
jgi:hypothetical protein